MSLKLLAEPQQGAEGQPKSAAGVNLTLTGRLLYPSDDRVLRFLREGWFEYRELAMMSRLVRPGDCFVDIGAHCGLYSRLASRRLGHAGTVVAVEPNPALHPFLQANLDVDHVLTTQDLTVGSVNLVGAAVAAESGEALLHTGEAGWTAYSSLQPTAGTQFIHSISVATRSLESLVVTTDPGGQVIVKLDTEGLEFEILQQAVPFLKSRDDIHLMIEFDENNQALGGHTTGDLRKLLGDAGFALAMFDPESGMLLEHHSETALWGANLVATKAIDLLNGRLRNVPEDVAQETDDFLQSGAVADAIYRRSEQLDPVLRAIDAATGTMADIAASLEGRAGPKGSSDNNDAIAPASSALIVSMQDQLGRLEGSARAVAQELDAARETTATLKHGLAQIADKLKDQSAVTAREHALLKGEASDGTQPQHPAVAQSDPSLMDVHRMTVEMSAEIGNFIGTAKWFAENYADLTDKLSQQASAHDGPGEATATPNYDLAQIASRLKDQSAIVAREHALLKGEASDVTPPQQPAATESDPSLADVHRMTVAMSAEIDDFIGTAKWFVEKYADLTSEVSQQVSALDAYGQLQAETIKAEKALHAARLDLAALIATATGLDASKRGSTGAASLKLEHSIKTALTTAASHLSYGRRSLNVAPTTMPVESDGLSSELNRLSTANRDLLAEIHRLGLIANNAKLSRWLRLGDRLGVDVTRQLDTIVTLIADIERRAVSFDDRPKAQV